MGSFIETSFPEVKNQEIKLPSGEGVLSRLDGELSTMNIVLGVKANRDASLADLQKLAQTQGEARRNRHTLLLQTDIEELGSPDEINRVLHMGGGLEHTICAALQDLRLVVDMRNPINGNMFESYRRLAQYEGSFYFKDHSIRKDKGGQEFRLNTT